MIGIVTHLLAASGFGLFTLWLLSVRRDGIVSLWLAVAALLTTIWAALVAMSVRLDEDIYTIALIAETLRNAGWTAVLLALTLRGGARTDEAQSSRVAASVLAVIFILQMATDLYSRAVPGLIMIGPVALLGVSLRLAGAIGVLLIIHNLYIAAAPGSRWGARPLCVALGAVFAYDLNLYTVAFLTRTLSADLWTMRGVAMLIVLPLFILAVQRNRNWRIQLSRTAAFQTFSLAGIGVYLIVMAVAAYGIRLVGGNWGRLFQIAFMFATFVGAAMLALSGRSRAWLRVKIAKHFFAYRYDYREEWLRFIRTLGRAADGYGGLPERVVQAVADIVESPGGVLFTPSSDGVLEPTTRWNWPDVHPQAINGDDPLPTWLSEEGRIANLDELRTQGGGSLAVPEWLLEDRRAWLIVPLIHIDRFAGMLLLERPYTGRDLNWEDYDLLRTVGRQAASYIAEAQGAAALAEARKFDEFNRRFAFIMHDIKNLVSQLSLLSRNAERHADNPEFRADMVATLKGSVGKMNDLLARLSQHSGPRVEAKRSAVSLPDIAREVARTKGQHHAIDIDVTGIAIVTAEATRLEQVLGHLVQNAIEASAKGSPVHIRVREEGLEALIQVEDHGVGMSPGFVRHELFAPFVSTKPAGFGIGAFEAREIVHSFGGRLDVASQEGEGTIFTIRLPLSTVASVAPASGGGTRSHGE